MRIAPRALGLWVGISTLSAASCAQDTVALPTTRPSELSDAGARDGASVDAGEPCSPQIEVVSWRRLPDTWLPDTLGPGASTVPAGGGQVAHLSDQSTGGRLTRIDVTNGAETTLGEGFELLLEADEVGVLAIRGPQEFYVRASGPTLLSRARPRFEVAAAPERRLAGSFVWGCPEPFIVAASAGDPLSPAVRLEPRACPTLLAARDEDRAVFIQTSAGTGQRSAGLWSADSRTVRPLGSASERAAAAVSQRGAVWVNASGQVQGWTPERPDGFLLDDGPCVWLDAQGETVLMGCDPRPDAVGLGFVDRLQLVGPSGVRVLRKGGGAILSPRLGDGFVAWLEYETPESVCPGQSPAGQVWVAPLDGGAPAALGPVDAPCLCCGAFWPQPSLDVRGDTLVYTYPSNGDGRPEREVEAMVLRSACR